MNFSQTQEDRLNLKWDYLCHKLDLKGVYVFVLNIYSHCSTQPGEGCRKGKTFFPPKKSVQEELPK